MLDVDHGTYPFVTSSNTAGRGRRARAPAPARTPSATCSASPRPTPPGSARARSRPSCTTRSAAASASAAASSARSPAAPRRCGWFDAVLVRQAVKLGGIHGLALTKLDVLDGMATLKHLHRLSPLRPDAAPPAGRHAGAGRRRAALRGAGRLAGEHARRPQLRRSAGRRGQIRQAPGGAGRSARWRCSRPARTARTRSCCATRSPIERARLHIRQQLLPLVGPRPLGSDA